MLLPNKLFSYQATALPLFPEIMRLLVEPMTPNQLAVQLQPLTSDPIRLIDALDCLFALGRIALDEQGVIHRC